MYYIGLCDDGKNICADMEEMVFRYASDRDLLMGLEIWYTGEALDLAIKILDKRRSRFTYRIGQEYHYVPFGDILYFGSEGRKIIIKTIRGEETFYGRLKNIEKTLPPYFISIHQSYIVNHDFVVKYTYDSVELLDGACLPISKANRKKVREQILREDWNT